MYGSMGGAKILFSLYPIEDNVPEDFAIPSLYFPSAETAPSGMGLNNYQTKYSIYAKVFALTKRDAEELAEMIVRGIMDRKCRISVYNKDGTESGAVIKLDPPTSWGVDEGMAQVTLSYRIIRAYAELKHPAAKSVGINKNYD